MTGNLIKGFTREGIEKLNNQYNGTKEAIGTIAEEKVKEFMGNADIGLGGYERRILTKLISRGMMQSFSLGYGVGKVEGLTKKKVFL